LIQVQRLERVIQGTDLNAARAGERIRSRDTNLTLSVILVSRCGT
jgi:hypothetical protein